MIVRAKLSALKESRWHEYLIRFVLGGLTTVGAGIIADQYGPQIRAVSRISGNLLRQRHTCRDSRAQTKAQAWRRRF
jgi:hypothetical protein